DLRRVPEICSYRNCDRRYRSGAAAMQVIMRSCGRAVDTGLRRYDGLAYRIGALWLVQGEAVRFQPGREADAFLGHRLARLVLRPAVEIRGAEPLRGALPV